MADFDKARIDALLRDLRSTAEGETPSVHELARRHQLDPMIVRRLAQSEQVALSEDDAVPEPVDEEADTGPIG